MPPSERAMRRAGNRTHTPDHNQSAAARKALAGKTVGNSSKGGSGDGIGAHAAEPVWRHTTVPVSAHAARNGSQAPLWTDAYPSCVGNSGKLTALKPRAAFVRIS